ncbi:Formate dehydrogenase H [Pseudobythopirellula maris]|uniref:Formate dehydrogenase H n=1 Tax=Pseudobythopirellula maris TaxID=2527991 RepID=A0A5C5ZRE6_9BACT|nr:FdhF/YdeP family oxidoreductase [Pseudobythopirellula maris]TWT89655.1 Formate dehydrogenase H [Pseudobythopirellula maris]
MRKVTTGGGWPAIRYSLKKARQAGGMWRFFQAMRSRNACKTCALGMGGQRGGMVNEAGRWPEVCKKSMQAMVADMQGAITPEFWRSYSVEQLRGLSPRDLENCGRLVNPVVYEAGQGEAGRDETGQGGGGHYRPISWDEAYERIAAKLRATAPDESFWYFSGRSGNEAGFLLQLFARVYGTNNVNNCSYYCHQASGVGLTSVTGSGTATITLEDLDSSDLIFLIGGNPASNHPRLMTTLKDLRRRGGDVIVVNTIRETGLVNFSVPSDPRSLLFGSKIASQYVRPHIGGDLALLTGVAKRLLERGEHAEAFLGENCKGWPELRDRLSATTWEEILSRSGAERSAIDEMADRYARAKRVVFAWTMGITHHAHGVENVQAIANLALMRGMVGKPGAGLMPIRGHSNVQGIGSVGVTPRLKEAVFERLESHFGLELPTTEGRDTMACIEGAAAGELKMGFCLGGNLYGSNPDSAYAAKALQNLDTAVYLSTTLNTGHAHGTARETIILPVLARDEEPQATTQESMFNFVRLSDGGPRRLEGPRSEVEVIAQIAEAALRDRPKGDAAPIDWASMRDTGRIREAIAAIVPGYERIAEIGRTKQEFQIAGRTFHEPRFATATGKAQLHTHALPELAGRGDGEIRLMTIRSEGQFNTVVYEEHDLYRNVPSRDVVLLHPQDIERLGLKGGDRVTVRGPAGALGAVRVHPFEEIRPGNGAMYYPEANALVGRGVDPSSKTPAFKCVVVTVTPELAIV